MDNSSVLSNNLSETTIDFGDNTSETTNSYYRGDNIEAVFSTASDVNNPMVKHHKVLVKAYGSTFEDTLLGKNVQESYELLYKAINNRTIERDYFQLYCDLLDGSISEEDFDRIIEQNPSDYIIEETGDADLSKLELALAHSKNIKGINSLEDFTSLFSFDLAKVEKFLRR